MSPYDLVIIVTVAVCMIYYVICFLCSCGGRPAGAQAAPAPRVTLPSFRYTPAHREEEAPAPEVEGTAAAEAECAVCLEPFREGELCSEVPTCHHLFHWNCIHEWTREMSGSCPLCRARITPAPEGVSAADVMV